VKSGLVKINDKLLIKAEDVPEGTYAENRKRQIDGVWYYEKTDSQISASTVDTESVVSEFEEVRIYYFGSKLND
jgi:hypothetical protein